MLTMTHEYLLLQEELVDEYSVNVMPTFVLFRNGQKVVSPKSLMFY